MLSSSCVRCTASTAYDGRCNHPSMRSCCWKFVRRWRQVAFDASIVLIGAMPEATSRAHAQRTSALRRTAANERGGSTEFLPCKGHNTGLPPLVDNPVRLVGDLAALSASPAGPPANALKGSTATFRTRGSPEKSSTTSCSRRRASTVARSSSRWRRSRLALTVGRRRRAQRCELPKAPRRRLQRKVSRELHEEIAAMDEACFDDARVLGTFSCHGVEPSDTPARRRTRSTRTAAACATRSRARPSRRCSSCSTATARTARR